MTSGGPSAPRRRRLVVELARAHGVQPDYRAQDGSRQQVAEETLLGVLDGLGVSVSTAAAQAAALAERRAWREDRELEPVVALRGGRSTAPVLSLPAGRDLARAVAVLEHEDGTVVEAPLASALQPAAPAASPAGRVAYRLRLSGDLALAPGYHQLRIGGPRLVGDALVIAAPPRCPAPPRGWGVFAPLHAVRRRGDWGVGSFSDLAAIGQWAAAAGADLVGTLPLFAALLDGPVSEPSPYLPASRVAWNELYIDVERLPEVHQAPEAAAVLASSDLRQVLVGLRRRRRADPEAVLAAKRRVLQPAAAALFAGDSERRRQLQRFVALHPEVELYARFRAASETFGMSSAGWPAAPAAGPVGAAVPEPVDEDLVRYHLYVQWVADHQLGQAAAATGLYLDVPVGVHRAGFDPWWQPDAFALGLSGGAPPDDFFPGGQDWGFPPLHPDGIRRQRYRYPIAVFRHAMRHASVVRIDHVMGLHRLFVAPAGAGAGSGREPMAAVGGAYLRYRADELRAVVVLEAWRAGVAVVGEDLGTVPPEVRRAMRRDGMLRSFVVQFEVGAPEAPLPDPPADVLASLGTHDLPPFAAFWDGDDIEDQVRRGLLHDDAAAARRARRRQLRRRLSAQLTGGAGSGALGAHQALVGCLRLLLAGPARLVLVDLEDLWGEREPQNRPGTGPEAGNFRRRMARRLDQICNDAELGALLRTLGATRRAGTTRHDHRRGPKAGPATSGGEGGGR